MAKKKEWGDDYVSLRLENPKEDARTPLEGKMSGGFSKGDVVFLQDGKKLVSTGLILEVGEDYIRTSEGKYLIFKEREV